ncbi:hypothetical protein DUNSADRAFT_8102 [Dunaliella salina]|uniref:Uncharacterized protein n=1 Tax=Dunaliella salina TaxID=3046 RepID=A0ABQ7GK95_DUNSA|nr:hypothetical protein DUNSADRAFT_8102 [Dunaliella salina]|eukprot:KAF5834953.1 hypothetical protein DUNSADRAFT_8102 [Dunaliella salina]
MSRLLQLYESFPDIFDDIIKMVRGDTGFKSLFQCCRTFHTCEKLFLCKLTTLKLLLWNEEANGSVAAQIATVPRGAHIVKLLLRNDSFGNKQPLTTFQRGVFSHLNFWRPGMLELGNITSLELQGHNFDMHVTGSFGGTLHSAFPQVRHLAVPEHSRELLVECAKASKQLKSLVVTCDSNALGTQPELFETLGRLTSLEALTIYADCVHHHDHGSLAGLTNLAFFTWDLPKNGEYEIYYGNFGGVFPCWNKLTSLSLFHCSDGLPPIPGSLKCLHVQCLDSYSLYDLHLLPEELMFNIDMLILDCEDLGAAHAALANLQSANIHATCAHLRLLCRGRQRQRGLLGDVLPLLAKYGHILTGTHEVSAMHVIVKPGEIPQLASLFNDGVNKVGLIDYSLASWDVLKEATCMPGLSILQLQYTGDSTLRACEVQAACVARHKRQLPQPLVIELGPYPTDPDGDYTPKWMGEVTDALNANTAGLPSMVTLRGVTCKFDMRGAIMPVKDVFF